MGMVVSGIEMGWGRSRYMNNDYVCVCFFKLISSKIKKIGKRKAKRYQKGNIVFYIDKDQPCKNIKPQGPM